MNVTYTGRMISECDIQAGWLVNVTYTGRMISECDIQVGCDLYKMINEYDFHR